MQACPGTVFHSSWCTHAATACLKGYILLLCHAQQVLLHPICVCSCVSSVAVGQAFEELVLKILETPALVNAALGSGGVKLSQQAQQQQASTCSC